MRTGSGVRSAAGGATPNRRWIRAWAASASSGPDSSISFRDWPLLNRNGVFTFPWPDSGCVFDAAVASGRILAVWLATRVLAAARICRRDFLDASSALLLVNQAGRTASGCAGLVLHVTLPALLCCRLLPFLRLISNCRHSGSSYTHTHTQTTIIIHPDADSVAENIPPTCLSPSSSIGHIHEPQGGIQLLSGTVHLHLSFQWVSI